MNAPFYIARHAAAPRRRRPFDGPWKPHWPRIGAALLSASPWAILGAAIAARLRMDPAHIALIGLAVGYGALCLVAFCLMAWGLGLLLLDAIVEPLARRFTRGER
jgi:CHASE2 domain-containing sensor protein